MMDGLKARLEAAERKAAVGGEAGFRVYDQGELAPLLQALGRPADEAAQETAARRLGDDEELWRLWLDTGHSACCVLLTGDDRFL